MRHRLATTAGSDAHFANEIGNAGIITEAEDIRETLMKNDIRAWLIILFAVARLFPPYNDLSSGTCEAVQQLSKPHKNCLCPDKKRFFSYPAL